MEPDSRLGLCGVRQETLLSAFVVFAECGVLVLYEGECPMTLLAARYTEDRADNFDIYLPRWLALRNKAIFGALFIGGEFVVVWCWLA